MMQKSERFIESRILWRLKQHKLPSARTDFWDSISERPEVELQPELGKPVLVSLGNDSNFIVMCVFGLIVKYEDNTSTVKYTDIDRIHDVLLKEREDKKDLSRLVIKLKTGEEIIACPEPSGPAFAVWNTLIMLQRMS